MFVVKYLYTVISLISLSVIDEHSTFQWAPVRPSIAEDTSVAHWQSQAPGADAAFHSRRANWPAPFCEKFPPSDLYTGCHQLFVSSYYKKLCLHNCRVIAMATFENVYKILNLNDWNIYWNKFNWSPTKQSIFSLGFIEHCLLPGVLWSKLNSAEGGGCICAVIRMIYYVTCSVYTWITKQDLVCLKRVNTCDLSF